MSVRRQAPAISFPESPHEAGFRDTNRPRGLMNPGALYANDQDIKTPALIQFNYSTAADLRAGQILYGQGWTRGGKFSYFPVAGVDLDTFGLYNVKREP